MVKARKPVRIGVDPFGTKITKNGKKADIIYTYNHYRSTQKPEWDGWADVTKAVPIPFDLQSLRLKERKRSIMGWWDGAKWVGLRLEPHHEVTHWKWHGGSDEMDS